MMKPSGRALKKRGVGGSGRLGVQAGIASCLTGLAALAAASSPSAALADTVPVSAPIPVGNPANASQGPSIARNSAGEVAVAWEEFAAAGGNIFLQYFSATGTALTSPILVDAPGDASDGTPAVALDDNGDAVVSWIGQTATDTTGTVYSRLFGPDGTARGASFPVGTAADSLAGYSNVSVAMDADGDFVDAWTQVKSIFRIYGTIVSESSKVYARAYSANGTAKTKAFEVDTLQGHIVHHECTSVAMNASGAFVVSWSTASAAEAGSSGFAKTFWQRAQRYNSSGKPTGAHILVSTFDNSQSRSMNQAGCIGVGMDTAGDFGLAWTDPVNNINAVTYGANGARKAGPVTVASYAAPGTQTYAFAHMDMAGNLGVFWGVSSGAIGDSTYGQWLNLDGSLKAPQFALGQNLQSFVSAVDGAGELATVSSTYDAPLDLTVRLFSGP